MKMHLDPIFFTDEGMKISVKDEQFLNALYPILTTDEGIFIVESFEHPLKQKKSDFSD